jgi:hypothetical protein
MQLILESRRGRSVAAVLIVAAVGIYGWLGTQIFRAAHLAQSSDGASLQKAVALEPACAEFRERLARYYYFAQQDWASAIQQYRAATALNPYMAEYWFDLATAYQVTGDVAGQKLAVERATHADPRDPRVAWQAANFYLLQGDNLDALKNFRTVAETDPSMAERALSLSWRAVRDPDQMLAAAVPPTPQGYAMLLQILMEKGELAAANTVWSHWLTLKNVPLATKTALQYIDFLVVHKQPASAVQAWNALAAHSPTLQRRLQSGNLIFNGGFEDEILNGGFDWHYASTSLAQVSIDSSEYHSGARSLSFTFVKSPGSQTGVSHLIPVEPSTHYVFRAYAKGLEIYTNSGPRIAIYDPYSNRRFMISDDIIGSSAWYPLEAEFTTGPDTSMLILVVMREPGNSAIEGQYWIDDVSLQKK